MPFKGFSSFSFGGHFVQRSGTILAILVEGHLRNIPVILKSAYWPKRRFHLKVFLFLPLLAILYSGAEPF